MLSCKPMRLALHIPHFTSKDVPIMVGSVLPLTVLINFFLFSNRYFNEAPVFCWATVVTAAFLSSMYMICGAVAVSLRNRFPNDLESMKRLIVSVILFVVISGVFLSIVLRAYDLFHFLSYEFHETDFAYCYISLVVMNFFLTFLNEGVFRFEKYKATITETEQLKKEYLHSQLLGLKSQMNPHFLFNSLNTLSSLISEDAGLAEDFLDHMSKVYRYLLRNHEEQLVDLDTELSFIRSYYFLLKARHADGVHLHIDVPENYLGFMIPPLTLQMLFENAMAHNTAGRSSPLFIEILIYKQRLVMRNTVQPRVTNGETTAVSLDNISNKFRLLCGQDISIDETEKERTIELPLIPQKEPSAA